MCTNITYCVYLQYISSTKLHMENCTKNASPSVLFYIPQIVYITIFTYYILYKYTRRALLDSDKIHFTTYHMY